jgi:hypothetical protein
MKQFPRDHDPILIAAETAWAEGDREEYTRLVNRWCKENGYTFNGWRWTRG